MEPANQDQTMGQLNNPHDIKISASHKHVKLLTTSISLKELLLSALCTLDWQTTVRGRRLRNTIAGLRESE